MKTYKITKINAETERTIDYGGGYSAEDVKTITKGYKQDPEFKEMYNRFGSKYMYIVDEE